jgi:copper(I)-binding protein
MLARWQRRRNDFTPNLQRVRWQSQSPRQRAASDQGIPAMLRLTMFTAAVMLPLATMGAAGADTAGPTVDQAWARATPGAATTGAVYFRVESPTDDRLVGLASPVAGKAELHTHIEENGVMQMREVEGGLPLPAGKEVELKPGGALHVMLIDLHQKLKAGDSFPLTLTFQKAGTRDVTVKVEKLGAMGPSDGSGGTNAMAHTEMPHDSGHPAGGPHP